MILKTKYFDLETDSFSFKEPESIRERLENSFKNCFTDNPSTTDIRCINNSMKISFKYEPTIDYFNTPFPIYPDDLIFQDVGHIEGYKIMDDDYTCRKFHYEHNHSYSIDEDPIPCEKGFHFCRELTNCFYYYCPTAHSDMASNIIYDLDVFKFFNVESNGITYKLGDKYCTNNITILEECSIEEILEAFKKHFNELLFDPNKFKVKLRGELYSFHNGIYHKIIPDGIPDGVLNKYSNWYIYLKEN